MGTFHKNVGAFHGLTVVVETAGPKTFVGRCWDRDEAGIVLLDADVHEEGKNPGSRADYLRRAYEVGVWKRFDRLAIPAAEIARVVPLGEWTTTG